MLDRLFGVLIALVGLAFLALLALLRTNGELAGDLKVSAFLFCAGAILLCIAGKWLLSRQRTDESVQVPHDQCDHHLLSLRRLVEFCAAVGCALTGARAVALLYGGDWVPRSMLWALASAPVLIGLFTLRILTPGAFQSGLFPNDVVRRWPGFTRGLLKLLLRIGLLGYPAIALVWPDVQDLATWAKRVTVQAFASIFITLLYASQVVVLHYGRMRSSRNALTPR